jgi:hypothetical protein
MGDIEIKIAGGTLSSWPIFLAAAPFLLVLVWMGQIEAMALLTASGINPTPFAMNLGDPSAML